MKHLYPTSSNVRNQRRKKNEYENENIVFFFGIKKKAEYIYSGTRAHTHMYAKCVLDMVTLTEL